MPLDLTSPHTADPEAPLVIRFAAVGDVVLLTVLLQALAQRYGRPVHVLGSGPWTPVLLGHDPAVGEVRLLSSRRAPYWLTPSQWAANRWLRAHRGPVYYCELDRWAERVLARSGIPANRVVRAWDHHPSEPTHWADFWTRVAALTPPGCPDAPVAASTAPGLLRPRLHVDPSWRAGADAWVARHGLQGLPLVLVQPGHKKTFKRGRIATAGHDKHWPAGHWAEVVRGIWTHTPGAAVLVCGSDREAGLVQEIVDAVGTPPAGARLINVAADQPSLQRLCVLAERAVGMISVDTGPAHVAGALDCPLVVLYASAGWKRWKPRAASADVRVLGPELPDANARLEDIAPAQAVAEWAALRKRIAP